LAFVHKVNRLASSRDGVVRHEHLPFSGERQVLMADTLLPHHKLKAYGVAVELLAAVRASGIRDAGLRDQAARAAKSACLNCAEGAAWVTRGDKARSFGIARAEGAEAAAAVEIASFAGDASVESAEKVRLLASRLYAMLTPLVR
jgi:four helix bundle protein